MNSGVAGARTARAVVPWTPVSSNGRLRVVDTPAVTFRTIDLARHAALCVELRRDSYACSFLPADRHMGADGGEYLTWLAARIAEEPAGHVHVWRGDEIVGQLEMRVRPGEPPVGHVNLFYLLPEQRGSGLGDALMDFTREFFVSRGVPLVTLYVSPRNARGLAYYRKHGWRLVSPEPNERGMLAMELPLLTRPGGADDA